MARLIRNLRNRLLDSPALQKNLDALSVGGLFPSDLVDTKVWLRSDLGVTLVSGAVSSWANQADTSLMTSVDQATASQRPAWVANVIDGKPVLRGTNAAVTLMQGAWTGALPQPNTVFVVARRTVVNATNQYMFDSNTPTSRHSLFTQANTTFLQFYAGTTITTAQATNAWGIWSVLYNGASSQAWRGSTSLASGNAGAQSMRGLTVFNYQGAGAFGLDGDMTELFIMVGDHSVGTPTGNAMLSYLQRRYPSAA